MTPYRKTDVISNNTGDIDLHNSNPYIIFAANSRDQRIEPPLQIQELIEIYFILMLDILIIFLDVCKHMMHVVLWVPPF